MIFSVICDVYVHIYTVCTCVISIRLAYPSWIMQVSSRNWSLPPLGSIMAAWVKVFSGTKFGALNFKWDSGGGLKRRRNKSVKGSTPLFIPSSSFSSSLLSLCLVNLFKKHLYSHTRLQGHVVMLLCYLNVKQNVRVMAECEYKIKMELLLIRELQKRNISGKIEGHSN